MTEVRSTRHLLPRLASLFALLIVGSACRGTTPINDLLADPGRYDGKTVSVAGEVTGSVGALGRGGYRLDDGTGSLVVISEDRAVPAEGANVGVKGEFQAIFTFFTESVAVLLEQSRFSP
ncbi:MAG: hypothetical protein ABFS14_01185 [Gemmatimonadota bacterium]